MHPLLNPDLGLWVWTFVAFIIVLVILRKFAWKPIISSLHEREQSIADSLALADKVKGEMQQLQSENESLLVKAREERALILKEAKATKEKIISEAKDQAKVEANRIMADVQVSINAQKMAAITEMKNQVGLLVLDITEKVLRRELKDSNAQEGFIKELADAANLN